MRLLFILVCGCLVLARAQTSVQDASGLRVATLKVKEIRTSGYRPSIRHQPPTITPTLGRGTLDRTDSQEVASLKEVRDDRIRRERELRAIGRESRRSSGSRSSQARFGYELRARLTNEGLKQIAKVVWAYRPVRNSQVVVEKKFYCQLRIEPGQSKNLKVSFPIKILNASFPDLRDSSFSDFVIEQVEYDDGSSWRLPALVRPQSLTGFRGSEKGKCMPL